MFNYFIGLISAFKRGSWEAFALGQNIASVISGFLSAKVSSQSGLVITLEELEIYCTDFVVLQ